jgi:hypothetical protein
MSETRPATPAELAAWGKARGWYEMISMENTANLHRRAQIEIGSEFCSANGLEFPIIDPLLVSLAKDKKSELTLKRLIGDVDAGLLGLSFPSGPSGPINVIGPLGMTADQQFSYQFGAILVFVGGVLIVAGLVLKIKELYERLETTEHNEQIALDFIDSQIASKPALKDSWEQTKHDKGWNQKQEFIEALERSMDKAINFLEKPVAIGITWAIPIAVGITLIYFLTRAKK